MRRVLPLAALLLLAAPAAAQEWSAAPRLEPKGGGRASTTYVPRGIDATVPLTVLPPEGPARSLPPGAPVTYEGIGNYHLVTARAEADGVVRTAMTVRYFSEPGPAPADLLAAKRPGFEIVPHPLPREHANFEAGRNWAFRLRLDGEPVAGLGVTLETANGSRVAAVSDAEGIARLTFPADFAPGAAPAHGRRRAAFVVSARLDRHLSAYNDSYVPSALDGRSLPMGAAFLVAGMAAALPLLRRKGGAP